MPVNTSSLLPSNPAIKKKKKKKPTSISFGIMSKKATRSLVCSCYCLPYGLAPSHHFHILPKYTFSLCNANLLRRGSSCEFKRDLALPYAPSQYKTIYMQQ